MVDGMLGPPGPTAGRIVNITVGVHAPVLRRRMEANIASAETWCQQIVPAECVVVRNTFVYPEFPEMTAFFFLLASFIYFFIS